MVTKITKAKIERIRNFLRSSFTEDELKNHVCDTVYGNEYWHGYRVGIQQILEILLEIDEVDYNQETDKIQLRKYGLFGAINLPAKEI